MDSVTPYTTVDERLWTRFQESRCTSEEIAAHPILRRWERCVRMGVHAEGAADPVLVPKAHLIAALATLEPLLDPDAPFDAFASSMANAGFCGVLADANGVITASQCSPLFERLVATTRLVAGAVWSEAARGTNGIGTVVAEDTPVAILGTEHFEQRNHKLACYAAPIRDVRRRLVAVLDATGPADESASFAHASVRAAAAAMESLLISRAYDASVPGGLRTLERLLASLPHAALLLEATGRARRANERLRTLLPAWRDADLSEVLEQSRLRLEAATRRAGRPSVETSLALRRFKVEMEPVGDPAEAFAVIVHLIPRGPHPSPLGRRARTVNSAFDAIVGSDPAICIAREQAARFANTALPILLLAETGTGKDLFARATHQHSDRAKAAFVAVNCGALSGSLLESELFGYAPGAFTGAASGGQIGKLAAADGGTLFLDEVAEMSPAAQAMLLRFLEEGTYYRLGEAIERHADVRVIAATSRDMNALVADGRLRRDLYYRLRGVTIRLPALRERSDRSELAEALLASLASRHGRPKPLGISASALAWIQKHEWPGNVRELRTALEYAVVVAADAPRIEIWHFPIEDTTPAETPGADLRSFAERAALLRALDRARGNRSDAARHLGVARSTLYRMLTRHGLRDPQESND